MRRKKAAALVGAAAVVGSLGLGGLQYANAADSSTRSVVLDTLFEREVFLVHSAKGGLIKSVETLDQGAPGDSWKADFTDHQNRHKSGKCSTGSTTVWHQSLGTVGVPSKSPWGPSWGAPSYTHISVERCKGFAFRAKVRINYVGDMWFQRVS